MGVYFPCFYFKCMLSHAVLMAFSGRTFVRFGRSDQLLKWFKDMHSRSSIWLIPRSLHRCIAHLVFVAGDCDASLAVWVYLLKVYMQRGSYYECNIYCPTRWNPVLVCWMFVQSATVERWWWWRSGGQVDRSSCTNLSKEKSENTSNDRNII